ncbi:MAG: ribonuclease, partial [Acidobacteriaceae bacterium]|nr:ribonuclease [Acidobacteriaceae bacterium]
AAARNNLLAGRLDVHRDGFGFVRPETRQAGGDDDIFIPPNEMNGAMQGDQVLVELAPPRPDGRHSGRIVRILSRRNPTVVGIFHYALQEQAPGNTVTPLDERITQPILIPFGLEQAPALAGGTPHRVVSENIGAQRRSVTSDLEGMVVDVEITDWPTPTRSARGRVIEILGREDDFGVDVEIVIRKHHLPHVFPPNVLDEARAVAHLDQAEIARRRDFRDLPIITIDGETAKDFDDAVLVRRHGGADGTWELQVHIADVAQYVTPGSALDLEARLRGTSVYFPDRAVPMLPQELSSDICSLRPGENRLVLSCLMLIDPDGEVRSYEVTPGVIRSAARMTYTQVHAVIDGDRQVREQFAPLVPDLERMYELARLLHRKRERRGSIDFDLPEPVIEFDARGAMQSIVRSERSWANRLIEEFMLSANECVASWLQNLNIPSLYRIHEKPEARRVAEFETVAATFGYSLGLGTLPVKRVTMKSERREHRGRAPGRGHQPRQYEIAEDIAVTPRMYQQLALKIAGKPEERILAHLMLRSLRQARYSEKNEGHFALAAPCYTHFTSPIRRYPDLIVHRIAKAVLASGESGMGVLAKHTGTKARERHPEASHEPTPVQQSPQQAAPLGESELAGIAYESSQSERRAEEAERELMEWKKVKFMQDRIGDDFDGMILSITKYGCFVELDNLFIEGLVPILSLQGDHYTFRENTRQIMGEHSGRRYSMGDRVRVVLDRVDSVQRRLQFSILEEVAPIRLARPAKTKTRLKSAKAHPYIPPKNKALRKGKQRSKNKRPGKKRS